RLVLAGDGERTALLLDLAEEAGVLDRQHGLAGEGLHQLDCALGKLACRLLLDREHAEHTVGADQRQDQHRAEPGRDGEIAQRQLRRGLEVRNLYWGVLCDGARECRRLRLVDTRAEDLRRQLLAETIRGAKAE